MQSCHGVFSVRTTRVRVHEVNRYADRRGRQGRRITETYPLALSTNVKGALGTVHCAERTVDEANLPLVIKIQFGTRASQP